MAVRDLQGNEVAAGAESKFAAMFLWIGIAGVLIAGLVAYRIYDCNDFNHRNQQRLRNLENFGAAATLRNNQRDWKYPWLVKDTSPVKLIFFDHPRFKDTPLTETNIDVIVRLIGALPNVESIHVARKDMSADIVEQLEQRLETIEFTVEDE